MKQYFTNKFWDETLVLSMYHKHSKDSSYPNLQSAVQRATRVLNQGGVVDIDVELIQIGAQININNTLLDKAKEVNVNALILIDEFRELVKNIQVAEEGA